MTIATGWYVPSKKGYAGRQRARWVLVVANDRVIYGRGGEKHYECKSATFQRWMKRVAAKFNPPKVAANKSAPAQLEIV